MQRQLYLSEIATNVGSIFKFCLLLYFIKFYSFIKTSEFYAQFRVIKKFLKQTPVHYIKACFCSLYAYSIFTQNCVYMASDNYNIGSCILFTGVMEKQKLFTNICYGKEVNQWTEIPYQRTFRTEGFIVPQSFYTVFMHFRERPRGGLMQTFPATRTWRKIQNRYLPVERRKRNVSRNREYLERTFAQKSVHSKRCQPVCKQLLYTRLISCTSILQKNRTNTGQGVRTNAPS